MRYLSFLDLELCTFIIYETNSFGDFFYNRIFTNLSIHHNSHQHYFKLIQKENNKYLPLRFIINYVTYKIQNLRIRAMKFKHFISFLSEFVFCKSFNWLNGSALKTKSGSELVDKLREIKDTHIIVGT